MSETDNSSNWRIKTWFPDLDEAALARLKNYHTQLLKFNRAVNLISSKTILHADAIHFADSIFSCESVYKKANKNEYLYDIGSGNGFPGLVYSCLYPDQKVILLDSDERKCEFLKHAIKQLGLANAQVKNMKVEALGVDEVSQAITRGFSPLPKMLLMMRKMVRVGGVVFHMKSTEWSLEVSQMPTQLCSIWQPSLEREYKLPVGEIKMFLVKTEKIAK